MGAPVWCAVRGDGGTSVVCSEGDGGTSVVRGMGAPVWYKLYGDGLTLYVLMLLW